jgi:hypothetical protein
MAVDHISSVEPHPRKRDWHCTGSLSVFVSLNLIFFHFLLTDASDPSVFHLHSRFTRRQPIPTVMLER